MKTFLIENVSSMNQESIMAINEIKQMMVQASSGGHAQEVYSDESKAKSLCEKAADLKDKSQHITLIHPHGISFQTYESLHGPPGENGRSGHSASSARDGMHGKLSAAL